MGDGREEGGQSGGYEATRDHEHYMTKTTHTHAPARDTERGAEPWETTNTNAKATRDRTTNTTTTGEKPSHHRTAPDPAMRLLRNQ